MGVMSKRVPGRRALHGIGGRKPSRGQENAATGCKRPSVESARSRRIEAGALSGSTMNLFVVVIVVEMVPLSFWWIGLQLPHKVCRHIRLMGGQHVLVLAALLQFDLRVFGIMPGDGPHTPVPVPAKD